MSVVACKMLGPGQYDIAADSILVSGWTQSKGDSLKFVKLCEVNGMLIGGVGTAEELAMFYLFCATRRPSAATESALIEFLSEFASWKNGKIGKNGIDNDYLIGLGSKVFEINSWFVAEVKNYSAIGAGQDYALAALHLGHSAEEAVKAAIELSVFCEAPTHIFHRSVPVTEPAPSLFS